MMIVKLLTNNIINKKKIIFLNNFKILIKMKFRTNPIKNLNKITIFSIYSKSKVNISKILVSKMNKNINIFKTMLKFNKIIIFHKILMKKILMKKEIKQIINKFYK